MAFDHENHMLDPVSGLQVHRDTGHLIGIEQHPPQPSVGTEFPKWVEPHQNHVVWHSGNHVSTPNFMMIDRNRVDGRVTVLVHDAVEESFALADPHVPKFEAGYHAEAGPAAPDAPPAEPRPVNPLADPHVPKFEAGYHAEAGPAAPDAPPAEPRPVNPYLQLMKAQ